MGRPPEGAVSPSGSDFLPDQQPPADRRYHFVNFCLFAVDDGIGARQRSLLRALASGTHPRVSSCGIQRGAGCSCRRPPSVSFAEMSRRRIRQEPAYRDCECERRCFRNDEVTGDTRQKRDHVSGRSHRTGSSFRLTHPYLNGYRLNHNHLVIH
jgi:hypothetical protein